VFSAARDAAELFDGYPRHSGALAALMGRTRATALARIAYGCSTSELAHYLGVSVAAASQHATVLRDNGLIVTRRAGSAVLHTVTPLGAEMLRVNDSHEGDLDWNLFS
jgi:DNA-binding transcriptional ArsR family regulator